MPPVLAAAVLAAGALAMAAAMMDLMEGGDLRPVPLGLVAIGCGIFGMFVALVGRLAAGLGESVFVALGRFVSPWLAWWWLLLTVVVNGVGLGLVVEELAEVLRPWAGGGGWGLACGMIAAAGWGLGVLALVSARTSRCARWLVGVLLFVSLALLAWGAAAPSSSATAIRAVEDDSGGFRMLGHFLVLISVLGVNLLWLVPSLARPVVAAPRQAWGRRDMWLAGILTAGLLFIGWLLLPEADLVVDFDQQIAGMQRVEGGWVILLLAGLVAPLWGNATAMAEMANKASSRIAAIAGAGLTALLGGLLGWLIGTGNWEHPLRYATIFIVGGATIPVLLALVLLFNSRRGMGDSGVQGRARLGWNLMLAFMLAIPTTAVVGFMMVVWAAEIWARGSVVLLLGLSAVAVAGFRKRQRGRKARPSLLG